MLIFCGDVTLHCATDEALQSVKTLGCVVLPWEPCSQLGMQNEL